MDEDRRIVKFEELTSVYRGTVKFAPQNPRPDINGFGRNLAEQKETARRAFYGSRGFQHPVVVELPVEICLKVFRISSCIGAGPHIILDKPKTCLEIWSTTT